MRNASGGPRRRGGRMELPLRNNNPLPMVADSHWRNKKGKWLETLSNQSRPRSREASAIQRATLAVRRQLENLHNMRPKATAVKQHVPRL